MLALRTVNQAAADSLILFLLPGGRPRRLIADIHAGGRPRRLLRPRANRSRVIIASSICSLSWRKSASIFMTSILFSLLVRRFDPNRCSEIRTEHPNLSLTQFRVYRLIRGVSSNLFCLPNKSRADAPFFRRVPGASFTPEGGSSPHCIHAVSNNNKRVILRQSGPNPSPTHVATPVMSRTTAPPPLVQML